MKMSDPKEEINTLVRNIKEGRIPAAKSWDAIKGLKKKYVEDYNQSSWNAYIGNRFQEVIHAILKGYILSLKQKNSEFAGLDVLTAGEAKNHEIITQNQRLVRWWQLQKVWVLG
jgi:hypothetical protein